MARWFAFWAALLIASCSGQRILVDTPTLYLTEGYPEQGIPEQLRLPVAPLLYVTDRQPVGGFFGSDRSDALIFGHVDISFGAGETWDSLVDASESAERRREVPIGMTAFNEVGRFRATPLPFTVENSRPVDLAGPRDVYDRSARQFQAMVSARMAVATQKEVVVYVHGFNSGFEDSAMSLAEVWHFSGRWGVPLLYTWPAGRGGLVGYFTDRESGEFTVFHLKETLRLLAELPEVEKLHIVAHSRGTDVVTTALRELVIGARAAGQDPEELYKISNLVLAAPDLDFGVVGQRLIAERMAPAFGRVTIYTNNMDGALGLSQFLMEGQRFGRVQAGSLTPDEQRIFANVGNTSFINVPQARGFFGHSYFRDNPGTLSDLALVIRTDAIPGGRVRPLTYLGGAFWEVPDGYPDNEQMVR
ncbi:MAG: alpha/beta hydrolase [Pseudomonadota bacterium]